MKRLVESILVTPRYPTISAVTGEQRCVISVARLKVLEHIHRHQGEDQGESVFSTYNSHSEPNAAPSPQLLHTPQPRIFDLTTKTAFPQHTSQAASARPRDDIFRGCGPRRFDLDR